jgi:hypothetical protein
VKNTPGDHQSLSLEKTLMAIRITCRNCHMQFCVKDEYAGKRTKCPQCGNPLLIPQLPMPPVIASGFRAPPPRPVHAAPPPASAGPPEEELVQIQPRRAPPAPARTPAIGQYPQRPQPPGPAPAASRRRLWPWLAGGGAAVLLVAAGLFFFLRGRGGSADSPEGVKETPAQTRESLTKGFKVTGSVTSHLHTQQVGVNQQTHHQWKVNLKLINETALKVQLGKDLLLVESNAPGMFRGVGHRHSCGAAVDRIELAASRAEVDRVGRPGQSARGAGPRRLQGRVGAGPLD